MSSNEHEQHQIPRHLDVEVNGREISVKTSMDKTGSVQVLVDDITSKNQIAEATRKELEKKFWFLSKEWNEAEVKERFGIQLDDHAVEVFVFGQELDPEVRTIIETTVQQFYALLKDKSQWRLESIQIRPEEKINTKNGEPFRGMEFPDQNRFELYSQALTPGKYRGGELNCTELQGALAHELTHIVLEDDLRVLWSEQDLGWRALDDAVVELPGGDRTPFYNTTPEQCPTTYAALQQDDDRAESVVAYLFDKKRLDPSRAQILDQVFLQEPELVATQTVDLPNTLPEAPDEVQISVKEQVKNLFGSVSVGAAKERKVIPLAQLREQLGIQRS